MSEGQQPQQVNLAALSLEQLQMLREQLENEMQTLSDSVTQLRHASNKYAEAKDAITGIQGTQGKDLLVPLTSSIYLPGKITSEKVLVDIGTGYYVEMNIEQGQGFTQRKIQLITDQINKVHQAINIKRGNLDSVMQVAQAKINVYKQQQLQQQKTVAK
ncbi:prefoldin subunit 5 [Tieghemostelium lacteum]|uniref:Prefoldin subunit 5 n=1 Tax=Tieghemostelium lacteum TaxID=361077 RepID=A0A151ZCJ1_TIELA|nr:prefoldin subunit 5 [Tieghemostelium lacteum]|eukprot:KYQ91666.1 prefoldin subunit 5 [Tieghemostelium lacteum]